MKKRNILAALVVAAALAMFAGPARAQSEVALAPIITRTIHALLPKPVPGGEWLKAEVVHFDQRSIIVREQSNERMILTFTYAPALKPHMQQLADKGGYQYGDKIKILFQKGKKVALKIRGKPSKPL